MAFWLFPFLLQSGIKISPLGSLLLHSMARSMIQAPTPTDIYTPGFSVSLADVLLYYFSPFFSICSMHTHTEIHTYTYLFCMCMCVYSHIWGMCTCVGTYIWEPKLRVGNHPVSLVHLIIDAGSVHQTQASSYVLLATCFRVLPISVFQGWNYRQAAKSTPHLHGFLYLNSSSSHLNRMCFDYSARRLLME